MWDYYNDKTIFITGGTGFLGTSIVYRLLTQTSENIIDSTSRKLRSKWTESLSSATVEKLLSTNRITAMNGDILLPDLGLSRTELSTLRQEVNIIIHSASSINIVKPLSGISEVITGASERLADMALTYPSLDRFVHVSTAYCNTYLHPISEDIEVKFKEEIYDPNHDPNVMKEWAQVQHSGSSDAYKAHDFPWSYGYAKNLTERLLLHKFTQSGVKDKLLILRPSIIGPAQKFPRPGYNVLLSSPMTRIAAIIALNHAGTAVTATKAPGESSRIYCDEVPVDVVADRLLAHLGVGSNGCVHAVSGKRARFQFGKWWESAASLRRLPGKFDLDWQDIDWKSNEQHPLARFYVVFGTAFEFCEDKTVDLSRHPSVASRTELQLFTKDNFGELRSRPEDVYSMMKHISRNNDGARQILELYYQDGMKAKL
ncbi:unnamed protein product [Penicillium glandicola]